MTVLICEHNNHIWHRKPQRGRPPRYCDEHKHLYENQDIKVVVKKEQPVTKKSVYDLVPGLKEALMQTLHCEAGDHSWQRPSQRGKRPRNCPEHAQIGQVVRKVELTQERIAEAKENIRLQIESHLARVTAAAEIDDKAYTEFLSKPDDEIAFNHWLRENSRLLAEVIALRANEAKLLQLDK